MQVCACAFILPCVRLRTCVSVHAQVHLYAGAKAIIDELHTKRAEDEQQMNKLEDTAMELERRVDRLEEELREKELQLQALASGKELQDQADGAADGREDPDDDEEHGQREGAAAAETAQPNRVDQEKQSLPADPWGGFSKGNSVYVKADSSNSMYRCTIVRPSRSHPGKMVVATGEGKTGLMYAYTSALILASHATESGNMDGTDVGNAVGTAQGGANVKESARDNADKAEPPKPKVLHVMATSSPHCSVCAV